jgi:hypothetical protein
VENQAVSVSFVDKPPSIRSSAERCTSSPDEHGDNQPKRDPPTGLPVELSFRLEEQNGYVDTMPDSRCCSAEKDIGKEAMSVRAHGH